MNFLKKFATSVGLAGWAIAALVSMTQYGRIFFGQCAFLSAWPFCSNAATGWQMMIQLFVLVAVLGALLWGGLFASRMAAKGETAGVSKKVIYLLAGLSMLGAFLLTPFASADSEYYFSAGKALDAGQNLYAGEWRLQNRFIEPTKDGLAGEIMYGPLMMPVLSAFYRMSGDDIVWFIALWKLFMIVVFAVCGYLVYRLIRMRVPDVSKEAFMLLWATQPLLLFEWIGNGHFDGLWLLTVLGALLFAQKGRWWAVFPLLVVGVWIKFIPVLMAPWFVLWWWQGVRKDNWKGMVGQLAIGGALSATVTYLAWKPYWIGSGVFKAILLQSKWAVSSIFSVLYYGLKPFFDVLFGAQSHWFLTRAVQGGLLILFGYLVWPYVVRVVRVILKKHVLSERAYASAIFVTMLAYLLIWQKSFWPWYFSWLIPIGFVTYAGLKNVYWEKIGAWIGTAPLLFYIPWMLEKGNADGLWFYSYVVLVVMAYPLWQLIQWRRNGYNEVT